MDFVGNYKLFQIGVILLGISAKLCGFLGQLGKGLLTNLRLHVGGFFLRV